MSVRLAAPYPAIEAVTYLPNPEFGDSEGTVNFLDLKRSINSTRYTYVRAKDGRKRLQFRFGLTRMKALELRAFIFAYHSTKISLTDHLGQVWHGYITTNPNEFESTSAIKGTPGTGSVRVNIQIEFEGTKQ
jgi:hypothetical protein